MNEDDVQQFAGTVIGSENGYVYVQPDDPKDANEPDGSFACTEEYLDPEP